MSDTQTNTKNSLPSVFVSYARADSVLVERLVGDLEDRGHDCWVDTSDIPGGDIWLETIADGIENTDVFITLISEAANQSDYVSLEYLHAGKRGKARIPVLIDHSDLPWYMADRQAIPLRPDYTEGLNRLLADLSNRVPQISAKPEGDQRSLELAYLHRLQLGELQHTELYTPMAGIAHLTDETSKVPVLPSVVMRPELELLPFLDFEHREIRKERRRFEDVLTAFKEVRRVVLLGEPGAGKTTTLWKLASNSLENAIENPQAPLPLLIKLGEWTDPDQSLEGFIARQLGTVGVYFKDLLKSQRALLLMDGLNETPVNTRDRKAAQVKNLLEDNSDLSAVVTCRELDYTDALKLGLDTLTIRPLDPPRILEFVKAHLTAAIDPGSTKFEERVEQSITQGEVLFWKLAGGEPVRDIWLACEAAGVEFREIWSNDDISKILGEEWDRHINWRQKYLWTQSLRGPYSLMRLAGNPYMLFMLTQVYLGSGDIPDNRGILFDRFVQILLLREKLATRDDESRRIEIQTSGKQLLDALSNLAWTMQSQRRSSVNREEAGERESSPRTVIARDTAADIMTHTKIHQAAGASLLSVSDKEIRFTHQLLQEYFTALGMQARLEANELEAHRLWPPKRWWERTGWEEATILLAGLHPKDTSAVVNWLAEANPEVVAQCIQRSGARTPERLLKRLREEWIPRLTDVAGDPHPAARAAVGRALSSVEINGKPLDNRPGVGVTLNQDTNLWLPDIDWVKIPGGPFIYQDNQKLKLPTFFMARYPVTNSQFQAFVDDPDGYRNRQWWDGLAESSENLEAPRWSYANHPRETVYWYEAMAFCAWLSDRLKIKIRLPTEQEWEKAARGTHGNEYPWGNKYVSGFANIYETWSSAGEYNLGQTSPVGIYPQGKSPYGLLDMAGNVWEWGLNKYVEPKETSIGGYEMCVWRGGSWDDGQDDARASARYDLGVPDDRSYYLGFRVYCLSPIK